MGRGRRAGFIVDVIKLPGARLCSRQSQMTNETSSVIQQTTAINDSDDWFQRKKL